MSGTSYLKTLEDELKKIRGRDLDPVTKIWWHMLSEDYLKLVVDNTRENDIVLDVGCGVGNYIIALCKINRVCVGIDPLYEVSLLRAQQKAKNDAVHPHLIRAVGENLPFGAEKFDFVLLLSTLQHVTNQDKVLSEIRRVLKDNGLLLVSVPTNRNISTLFIRLKRPEYFTKDFDLKELRKLLTESGFQILKVIGCGFFPPFAKKACFICHLICGEKITKKMIKSLDIFAKTLPITASSVVALCKVLKAGEKI